MRIKKIHIQNYRSIIDGEEFDLDKHKTILVGPNEAGKTAVLQAIQHINPPKGTLDTCEPAHQSQERNQHA